ncbi:MAG TPA: aspartyl protease family protein [Candidatus Obscuribacterales bacterium]
MSIAFEGRLAAAIILLFSIMCAPAGAEIARERTSLANTRSTAKAQAVRQSAEARALADAVLKAYGGYAKMKELDERAFKSIGKIVQFSTISSAANTFDSETVSKGEMLRTKIDLMGQPLVTGYDGKRCWIQQGEEVFPADPTTTQRIVEEIKHGLVLLLKLGEKDASFEIGDKKEVQGRPCTGLKIYAEDGKATTFYIDDETHLVLRSEYLGTDLEQGVNAMKIYDYSDNRPVFGSVMPYRVDEFSDKKKTSETTIVSIEPANVEDSIFSMPEEKQIARLKQGPVVIPFDYVSNEIIINATVNNKMTLRFLVDTGATQSIFNQDIAREVGEFKPSNFAITTGAGHMSMNYMSLDTLQLGEVTLTNVPIAVTNLSSFAHLVGNKPAGLIGANILKRFLVTVDYDKKQLILADPHSVTVAEGAHVVKTKPALGVSGLAVEGVIDGKVTATCLVDTGAAFNNISETVVKPILPPSLLPIGEVLGLDGKKIKTSSVRFKKIDLSGVSVDNPVFSVAPASSAASQGIFSGATQLAVLGNPFWKRFRLTIDYRGQRLILERSQEMLALAELQKELTETKNAYRQSPDYRRATQQFRELANRARQQGLKGMEALCIAEGAAVEFENGMATKKTQLIDSANAHFEEAVKVAREGGTREQQAQVLAMWCAHQFTRVTTAQDLANSKRLLIEATKLAPTDPAVSTAAALMLIGMKQSEIAEKVLDQSLTLDPSNWTALWAKYKINQQAGRLEVAKLVMTQLKYYYPSAVAVKNLEAMHPSSGGVSKLRLAAGAQP